MSAAAAKQVPHAHTIAYRAGLILFKEGAILRSQLVGMVSANTKNSNINAALDKAIVDCWLTEDHRCRIDLSEFATNHYSGHVEPEPEKYVGIVAAPRHIDVMSRPPISKKYIPNSRGFRDDIPESFQRDHQSFQTRA